MEPLASSGGTIKFVNYAWNRGDTEDSVRLSFRNSNFPAGTTIAFFQPDGNEVGVPLAFGLTPPIKPNEFFKFITVVVLPASATGGPYQVDVRGTSRGDTTKFDAVRNALTSVAAAQFEFAHDAGGTLKPAPGAVIPITSCTLPFGAAAGSCTNLGGSLVGTTQVVFPLFVQSSSEGVVTLSAAASADFATPVDGLNWEVKFYEPALTTGACVDGGALKVGTQITSFRHNGVETTPATTVGGTPTARFMHAACAVVTKKLAQSGPQDFYFKVTNLLLGSSKTLFDQVNVSGDAAISLSFATTSEQVFDGSPSVEYQAFLANIGNVSLRTCKFVPKITGGSPEWTATLSLDKIDKPATATVPVAADFVTPFTGDILPGTNYIGGGTNTSSTENILPAGKALRLILKVTAPNAALQRAGSRDDRIVTIEPDCTGPKPPNTPPVTVTTRVIDGKLKVVLTQAAYTSCSDTPAGPLPLPANYSDQPLGRGAPGGGVKPGQCVCYRVVAKNGSGVAGDEALANVKVTNPIPAYTKLFAAAECTASHATVTPITGGNQVGSAGYTGELKCTATSLAIGESVEMKFCVKIDQ